jgi:hypothetical protein
MQATKSARYLVSAWLALAAAPALAVDPSLHNLPDPVLVTPASDGSAPGVAGVEVREIRDLGARGAESATGPQDLW